ncbi:MAG: PAS domain S-box protein, partial [Desulfobacteraceae bacterium]|nr:PAS domain S-box protein [Desulfobacteraceae bacterium]
KDGHKVPVLIGAGPRFDKQSGEFLGTMGVVNDITERKHMEEALQEKTNFLQNIIDTASDLVSVTDIEGSFKFVDLSHSILGYDPDSLVGRNVMEFVHPDDYQETATAFAEFLANREDGRKVEYRYRRADGDYLWFETVGKFILDDAGDPKEILFSTRDVTERKRAERELKRIEWMLSSRQISNIEAQAETYDQGYGDLTELNQDGIILKSIGHDRLENVASDYLELLGTSSAIYEVNGDYAFGIFASGWCRMMDKASRKRCNTPNNVDALNSGRWLCHESCWTDCSQKAIATHAEVDIECHGGIRLYAVPIFAGGNVIGVINFGYGDPPKDPETLKKLADLYHLDHDDLLRESRAYDSRPPFMIETAKKRLNSTAKLIGSMVEATQALEELKEREAFIKATLDNLPVGVAVNSVDPKVNFTYMNENFAKFYRTTREALVEPNDFWEVVYTDATFREEIKKKVLEDCARNDPERMQWEDVPVYRPGKKPFYITAKNIPLPERNLVVSTVWDVTERKQAEAERDKLQNQFNQAQKMESVGRLAGGVAHDFNNMLGIILGHTELALLKTDEDNDLIPDLKEIQNAAKRSADITKQLLAFARI